MREFILALRNGPWSKMKVVLALALALLVSAALLRSKSAFFNIASTKAGDPHVSTIGPAVLRQPWSAHEPLRFVRPRLIMAPATLPAAQGLSGQPHASASQSVVPPAFFSGATAALVVMLAVKCTRKAAPRVSGLRMGPRLSWPITFEIDFLTFDKCK